MVKKLKEFDYGIFYGEGKIFKGKKQIINPHLSPLPPEQVQLREGEKSEGEEYQLQYPTVNGVYSNPN